MRPSSAPEVVTPWPVLLRWWHHPRRSPRGHPPRAPGEGPRHGRRAGRRARGVREDRPPRPRGARHRRHPGVLAGWQGRRLAAARRRPHGPQRAHGRRGPHAVHGRRAVVDGDAGGQGGAAQARPGAAGDVPRRRRGGGVGRRARPRRLGWHDGPPAGAPRRAAARRRRRRPGAPRLRRPHAQRDAARRAPAGLVEKDGVWYLVADTDAGLRTFRVNRVRSVEPTGEPVVRPAGFDLAATWDSVVATIEEKRTTARAVVRMP